MSRRAQRFPLVLSLLLLAAACDREPQGPAVEKAFAGAPGTYDPIPELAYIGIGYEPYVTVIGVPDMREMARIYVPANETGTPAISRDGSFAFVPHTDPAGVSKVDLATHTVLETAWLVPDGGAFDIVLTPNGQRAFVTQFDGHMVAAIDTREMELIKEIPLPGDYVNGIAIDPGGHTLFVAVQASEKVHVIDARTLEVVETITTGMVSVNELALTPGGELLFVTAISDNAVVVIDVATRTVETVIPTPNGPVSVAIPRDGTYAYVTCRGPNLVAVIDIEARQVVDEIAVEPNPQRIAVNTNGKLALTTHRGNGQITLINLENREVLATIYEADSRPRNIPFGIAIAAGSRRNTGGARPGVPHRLYIAGGGQQPGIVDRPTFDPFKVQLYDAFNEPIADAEITWEVTGGGGQLHPDQWPTDDQGRAWAHLWLGPSAGINTVTASVPGVDPVTFMTWAEEGTGAFGFIRLSTATGWYTAYDLGLQGRPAWFDARSPRLKHQHSWHGLATLRQPWHLGEGHWGFRIDMGQLSPGVRYTLVLARYGLQVNGLYDAEEILTHGGAVEPDELVLLGGFPAGYPDNPCDWNPWLPVLADANPFVIGYDEADADGILRLRCNLLANGQWWSDDSGPAPPGAEAMAPFIPNSTDLAAGRFTLPSYNYLYLVEGRWAPGDPEPVDRIVRRWQLGIDLDLLGDPIPGGYAPVPLWPNFWP